MDNMLVCVFEEEYCAVAAAQALGELRTKNLVLLYALEVVLKGPDNIEVLRYPGRQQPVDPVLSKGIRSLIRLLDMSSIARDDITARPSADWIVEMAIAGVDAGFLGEVRRYLLPGRAAIVAEIEEETLVPMNEFLEARGGVIFRCQRSECMDDRILRDMEAWQSEIKTLEGELRWSPEGSKAPLLAKMSLAKASLEAAKDRTRRRAELIRGEAEAKIVSLQVHAANLQGLNKAKIEQIADEVRANYANRATRINLVWQVRGDLFSILLLLPWVIPWTS